MYSILQKKISIFSRILISNLFFNCPNWTIDSGHKSLTSKMKGIFFNLLMTYPDIPTKKGGLVAIIISCVPTAFVP